MNLLEETKLVRTETVEFELPRTSSEVKDAIKFLNKELAKLYPNPSSTINWWIIKFISAEEDKNKANLEINRFKMEVDLYSVQLRRISNG